MRKVRKGKAFRNANRIKRLRDEEAMNEAIQEIQNSIDHCNDLPLPPQTISNTVTVTGKGSVPKLMCAGYSRARECSDDGACCQCADEPSYNEEGSDDRETKTGSMTHSNDTSKRSEKGSRKATHSRTRTQKNNRQDGTK